MELGGHKHVYWKQDRWAHNRKVARAEETEAEITKLLDRFQKRAQDERERDKRVAQREDEGWEEALTKRIGRKE